MRIMEAIRKSEGGMKKHYTSLVAGLAAAGHKVYALCGYSGNDAEALKDAGAEIYPFVFSGKISPMNDLIKILKLAGLIRRLKPGIIHCHGLHAGLVCRPAAIIAGCPSVYTVHNFVLSGRSNMVRMLIIAFEKLLAGKTAAVITVSGALKAWMTETIGIDSGKVHVIYNARPEISRGNREKTRERHGVAQNEILVGTVARLIPSKGIDLLIEAAAGIFGVHPDVKLLIAGSGPDEGRLRSIAKNTGFGERIIFAGQVPNIEDYYAAFDCFILPTLSEGLGISVMEAMSAGLPVIASDTGGIPELIAHMKNGVLIRPGNKDEIAGSLLFLLQNRNIAAELGKHASESIGTMYSEEEMIKKTIRIFEEVCFSENLSSERI